MASELYKRAEKLQREKYWATLGEYATKGKLNDTGRAMLESHYKLYPKSTALLFKAYPALASSALKVFGEEDLSSIVDAAIVEGALRFQAGKKTKFTSYLALSIRGHVLGEMRKATKAKRYGVTEATLGKPRGEGDETAISLAEGRNERARDNELKEWIEVALADVVASFRDREVFKSLHGLDGSPPMKPKEVARLFGIPQKKVLQIDAEIMAKLRDDPDLARIYQQLQ